MTFSRDLDVKSDPSTSWTVLTDVPRLVTWISIVDDARELEPLERYTAVLMDRIGPFKLRADLDIAVSEVEPGRHIRVRANGEDRQVSSRIGVDATLTLSEQPDGHTRVSATGSYEVVGRVATLGAGMIKQKASKLLDEFFAKAGDELGSA
jgi:carbon monoxide dehydrogenase subunit G